MRVLSPTVARGSARRLGRRAATMLEFVLILPIMLFVTLFTVDMGHVVLVNGTMQDAAYSAARAGAQVGGASYLPATNTFPCSDGSVCTRGVAYEAFSIAKDNIEGFSKSRVQNPQMHIVSGSRCSATAPGSTHSNYVTVRVTYSQKMITPGLTLLMSMTGSGVTDGAWDMAVAGTSRCEVYR